MGSSLSQVAEDTESVLVDVYECDRNFSQVFCLRFGDKYFVASQGCNQQNDCFSFLSVLLF